MFKRPNQSQPASAAPPPFFVVTDTGARVELSDHAREQARRNLPATEATDPNEFETAIIRQAANDNVAEADKAQAVVKEQTAAFDRIERQLPTAADLDALVERADAEVEHDLAANTTLARRFDDYDKHDGNLRAFVGKHGLDREPQYPESMIWHLLAVVILFMLESVANAGFFLSGNSLGFVGAFGFAASIALVNVVGGFCFGWRVLPHKNHISRRNRRWTFVALVAYTLCSILFNLAVAHFRDLHTLSNTALHDAFGNLLRGPFDLSMSSTIMFAVGLIFWAMAIIDGYKAEDPYPGYKAVHTGYLKTRNAYEADRAMALQQVLSRERAVGPACDEQVRKHENLVEEMNRGLLLAHKAVDGYGTRHEHIQNGSDVHLRKYRDVNKAGRRTDPPAYFEDYPVQPVLIDQTANEPLADRLRFARQALEAHKAHAFAVKAASRARMTDIARRFDEFLLARLPQHATTSPAGEGPALSLAKEGAQA